MTHFDTIPRNLKQTFNRVRRNTGLSADAYGDATFTETTTTGFRGFFQSAATPGSVVILAGTEVIYDAVVYTTATMSVQEGDRIIAGSSTATSLATRYVVHGITDAYDGLAVDHKEVYVRKEIV